MMNLSNVLKSMCPWVMREWVHLWAGTGKARGERVHISRGTSFSRLELDNYGLQFFSK